MTLAAAAEPKTTVLLVDHDPSMIGAMARQLENQGCRVAAVTNGLAAWERFKNDPCGIDIIVAYHNMPDISGDELAGRISKLRPDLPVMLLWSQGGLEKQKIDQREPFLLIIIKPLFGADLQSIKKMINKLDLPSSVPRVVK
ncbi:MAG: response regulator [Desulfarculaceae bacterium]|nr:response regulator [Desulfarculaceae bacterium]MCF8049478.1 response regulator [Desulfarculaceae bacterium]